MNKLCLVILDGFGIVEKSAPREECTFDGSLITYDEVKKYDFPKKDKSVKDAVRNGSADDFVRLFEQNPHTLLKASGLSVGLPDGQMGNSEVGHLNIGAGRVLYQDLLKISDAMQSNQINDIPNYADFFANVDGVSQHVVCLVSDGNVHASLDHLKFVIKDAKSKGVKLYIHCITDGRDTAVKSGIGFVQEICDLAQKCDCEIASVSGRYYAMDRERNLDRTQRYFDTITKSMLSDIQAKTPQKYLKDSYQNGITDEFIEPCLFSNQAKIKPKDKVLFANFRADRMRQIVHKFLQETDCEIYTMTEYKKDFKNARVIFSPSYEKDVLSEVISRKGLAQLKVAELSKYAHVTYFLNGGVEKAFSGEDRVLVDMVDVPTFDMCPEMKAKEVSLEVQKGMQMQYEFICVNFANCDMVGHTGNYEATEIAVNTVTHEVCELYKKAVEQGYVLVVTADHGNSECMDINGDICTTHTTNRVPFMILNADKDIKLRDNGALCNIAPTIMQLMGL